jgi:hypothetical protein
MCAMNPLKRNPPATCFAALLAGLAFVGCASPDRGPSAGSAAPPDPLVRCTLLVPLQVDPGAPTPASVLREIEERFFARFGGYTLAGRVRGAYRMANGARAEDESLTIWVAVPPARIGEVRQEAARLARELKQESIYLEVGDAQVEFVGPAR